MDIQALVLFFYLLLPPKNLQQESLLFAADKENLSAELEAEIRKELLNILYSPTDDSIFLDFSDDLNDLPLDFFKTEEFYDDSLQETVYLNDKDELSLYEYNDEQLSIGHNLKNEVCRVSVNDSIIIRTKFDSRMRETERLTISNEKASKNAAIISKRLYYYKEDTYSPIKITEENKKDNIFLVMNFDGEGLKKSEELYNIDENGNRIKNYTSSFIYDNKKRLLQENKIEYENNISISKKLIYKYKGFAIPDSEYYENDILHRSVSYEDEDEDVYIERIFFDNDINVYLLYKHGRKIEERIMTGEEVVSKKVFE